MRRPNCRCAARGAKVGPHVEPSPWLGREPSPSKTPKLGLLVRESTTPRIGRQRPSHRRSIDSRDRERQPCPRTLPHCHLSSSGEPPPIPHPPAEPPTGRLHGHHFHLCSYGAVSQAAGSQQAEPLYTADTPSKLRAFGFPPFFPFDFPKSRTPRVSRTVLRISWMIRRPGPLLGRMFSPKDRRDGKQTPMEEA
jgi:hypothetical protein